MEDVWGCGAGWGELKSGEAGEEDEVLATQIWEGLSSQVLVMLRARCGPGASGREEPTGPTMLPFRVLKTFMTSFKGE